jgi:hypothetical protein
MRDKLIELTKISQNEWLHEHETHKDLAEYVADHLLANGVVVLQCKVGDTVYQTDGEKIYELEILDVCLRKNKPYYETESIDFDADAIGKSVFLTYKEALGAKMNTEQIIKALECCDGTLDGCEDCPYNKDGIGCKYRLPTDALALIKEQQAELTFCYDKLTELEIKCLGLSLHNITLKKEKKYLEDRLKEEMEIKEDMKGK